MLTSVFLLNPVNMLLQKLHYRMPILFFAHNVTTWVFRRTSRFPRTGFILLNTEPQAQVSVENVEDKLHISSAIKGAGIHIIVVAKADLTN